VVQEFNAGQHLTIPAWDSIMLLLFQFTLRRAILSTTLIALSCGCWLVPRFIDLTYLPGESGTVLWLIACLALPAAGIGAIFTQTLKGLYIGLAAGVFFVLASYAVIHMYLSDKY
jgi:hypothetical protein